MPLNTDELFEEPSLFQRAKNFVGLGEEKPKPASGMTTDDFLSEPPAPWKSKSLDFLKGLGGETAALLDLGLSLPGFAGGVIAGVGATAGRLAMGESPSTAYKTGREIGSTLSEPFMNPVKRVLDLFDSGKVYEDTKTVAGMNKFMELIQNADEYWSEKSGGKIPPGAFSQLADTLMVGAVGAPKAVRVDRQVRQMREALKNKETYAPEDRSDFVVDQQGTARRPGQTQAPRPTVEPGTQLSPFLAKEVEKMYVPEAPEQVSAGKPRIKPKLKQEGTIDPDLMMALGLGSAVGAVGWKIYDNLEQTGVPFPRWQQPTKGQPQAPLEGEPEPDELGNYLALGVPFAFGAAVKGKGGNWHPEAVRRLADPLFQGLARGAREAEHARHPERQPGEGRGPDEQYWKEVTPPQEHSERMVRNYLNKWAGTKEDPLRDVEIPFGEGTKRWEEVTDGLIKSDPIWRLENPDKIDPNWRMRRDEPIWHIPERYTPGAYSVALQSHLSHVGDYLRQNVPPEKLQNYDLVRAVKETAAKDAEMARLAEKESAASMKDLPVYKDYTKENPGSLPGMKWVELKLPEKLTEEQARTIKPIEVDLEEVAPNKYYATGSDGKAIQNNYTGEPARGPTPEAAFLSGQLAREGNQMGHCVGGYCEGVASGESRIFSLRDAKGKSHVTVEVEPARAYENTLENIKAQVGEAKMHEVYQAYMKKRNEAIKLVEPGRDAQFHKFLEDNYPELAQPESIVQIKGKQRAPNKEYLPYVQDFVREGKWGEVGDLGNTGLTDLKVSSGMRGNFSDFLAQRFPGQRFVSQEDVRTAQTEFNQTLRGKESGSVSPDPFQGEVDLGVGIDPVKWGRKYPEHLRKMGAAGAGAAAGAMFADPADQLAGALLGGGVALSLALFGKSKAALYKAPASSFEYGLGIISTRLSNISPELRLKAVDFERRNLLRTHEVFTRAAPFFQMLKGVDKELLGPLNRAILTNDTKTVHQTLRKIGDPALTEAWTEVRRVLHSLGTELQGEGRFGKLRPGYFPRVVLDREGLLNALGHEMRPRMEEVLQEAELKSVKARGTGLNQVEESVLINKALQDWKLRSGQPGFAKPREIDVITESLEPFYATPAESFHSYARSAIQELEKIKFFGKNIAETVDGGKKYINLDSSIGNVVREQLDKGNMTYKQAEELTSIMKSRFLPGERSSNPLIQDLKNAANIGLLGNVIASATQMGDLAVALYAHGLKSTLTSVVQLTTGRNAVSMKEFGLVDHIAEEFVSTRSSARALQTAFKLAGFSAIDQFGKNVSLNASLLKYQQLAKTPAGVEKIAAKYGSYLKEEFPQLIDDLKTGKDSDTVRSVLFAELSDLQPITRLEVPQAYLDMPNGRVIYMLKTFMLKQADILRRDSYNEIKKGDLKSISKGLYQLAKYATLLGVAGASTDAVKDWLLGRDVKISAGDVMSNVLKTFGWSEYVLDKAKKGKPIEAAMGIAAPPYQMMDDIIRADPKAVQYIPIIGKLAYSHFMGGKEKTTERREWRDLERLVPSAVISNRKQYREDITAISRLREQGNEDEFERRLEEMQSKYELTSEQVHRIKRDTKTARVYRRFKMLPEEYQRSMLEGMSEEDRERFLPHAKKKLRREFR